MLQRVMDQAPRYDRLELVLPAGVRVEHTFDRGMIVRFFKPTHGQAHTVFSWLFHLDEIPDWVLISNCDNAIGRADVEAMIDMVELERGPTGIGTGPNGVVATMRPDEHWQRYSYCHVNDRGVITRMTEKTDPTDHAVCGVYLLRGQSLATMLFQEDVFLSQAISRMRDIAVYRVREYHGWNDIQQIEEWEFKHCVM